jgi:sodium transport system permease protein
MNPVFSIIAKELKDTLRDRRTLMIMLIVPFLLLPLVLSLTTSLSRQQEDSARTQKLRIAITGNENGAELLEAFRLRKDAKLLDVKPAQYNELIREDSLDAALIIDPDFDAQLASGQTGQIELRYNATRDTILMQRVLSTVLRYEQAVLGKRLDSLGASWATIDPIQVSSRNVYTSKESLGKLAGGILPYFFVLFCLFGAMYPAIDLFTGEKERGTIETILTVPVSRMQLLIGKMAVITLSGLISGLLTILGLYLALQINPGLPDFLRSIVAQLLSPSAMILVMLMMIPLAIFFAGLLIPLCIYAKSFKEAQSIIQPLTFFALIPLVIGMLPGVELNFWTALAPVLNVALATKEVIAGTIPTGLLIVVFLALLVYAAIGILISARRFGDEKNLLRV